MKSTFDKISVNCSKLTTKTYSTSFSIGIRFLHKRFHNPIYSIYGFVRFADEIVDSFHKFNKEYLLNDFREQTFNAIENKISLNPILNSFQKTVNDYKISTELIETFFASMEADLYKQSYSRSEYEKYILGSAEVVGLMCLKVFTENNLSQYETLKPFAMKLGSAFQKINFLRDIQEDYQQLGRIYFPGADMNSFSEKVKREIETDIKTDFADGFKGIKQLPKDARFGVYIAYMYYYRLFKKIQQLPASEIMKSRVRIPNNRKYRLFVSSYLKHSLNLM